MAGRLQLQRSRKARYKPRMKRKPKKNARKNQIIIRCTDDEKRLWFAAAELSETGELSEWAREEITRAARRVLRDGGEAAR